MPPTLRLCAHARKHHCANARILAMIAVVASEDADTSRVNWSIRLVDAEAEQWDDLLISLRKKTGRRTLSKADIMRALVTLAAAESPVQAALVDALTGVPGQAAAPSSGH